MDEENQETLERTTRSRISRLFSAKQLYECVQPLFFLTYGHGLTPFYIKSNANGIKQLKHSIWGYVNVGAHLTVYNVCYILTLLNDSETVAGYFYPSGIKRFGFWMQVLSNCIGVTVIYLTAIIPKYYIQRSLEITQAMDAQLHKVGIKIMYSKMLRFSYMYILFMVSVNFAFTVYSFKLLRSGNKNPSPYLYVIFVMQNSVILIALAMFLCFTRMISMRLIMMHKFLYSCRFDKMPFVSVYSSLVPPMIRYILKYARRVIGYRHL